MVPDQSTHKRSAVLSKLPFYGDVKEALHSTSETIVEDEEELVNDLENDLNPRHLGSSKSNS
jgi:hypothetical protein